MTLYVNWKPNTYKISYDLDGGTYGNEHPTTATYDERFTVDNPSKTGYTFLGWKITGMIGNETHYYGNSSTTSSSITTKETRFKNLNSIQ